MNYPLPLKRLTVHSMRSYLNGWDVYCISNDEIQRLMPLNRYCPRDEMAPFGILRVTFELPKQI
jgi:hypothetical protein